jgi:hypothetical protein
MKLTRRQLRQIIKEALEIHHAPEDLNRMGPEEAYGMGYYAGKPDDPDLDDDGLLSVAKLVDMAHRISGDVSLNERASKELQRLSFAKDHEFGIDTIPHAKKDKDFEDIIGHT